ncbi:hypothetical protein FQN52_008089 [Onygenales sp. PD_12]|nr:hypothetical protein FQN52_008089 [Onygenales sp. PD_12]
MSSPQISSFSGARRQQNSSGEASSSSLESRIDSHDEFRMGGPGLLPPWPIDMQPASGPSASLIASLNSLAIGILARHHLVYEQIHVCQRYTVGDTPTAADNTLYIRLVPSGTNAAWIPALADLLTEAQKMRFVGRVELIDQRAVAGLCTFAPAPPLSLQQAWPAIQDRIAYRLASMNVNWSLIILANRGYWEEVAVTTVLIKARLPPRHLVHSIESRVEQDIDGYGLPVELAGDGLLWGVFSTVVFPSNGEPFARAGDSGAWVLTSTGDVTGLLIGGDTADGSSHVIPIKDVFSDIEQMPNIAPGTLELA